MIYPYYAERYYSVLRAVNLRRCTVTMATGIYLFSRAYSEVSHSPVSDLYFLPFPLSLHQFDVNNVESLFLCNAKLLYYSVQQSLNCTIQTAADRRQLYCKNAS